MLTISNAISNRKSKSALIPFITAGYPNLAVTSKIIHLLDNQQVNAIELGIPYSDALADGPIIQESSLVALKQKICIDEIMVLVKKLSSKITTPIIIFTYLNPILSKGIKLFITEIAESGVKGLVIPDLPIEEADYFISICNYYGIELILFISPASPDERVKEIISKAPGCIYLVSSYGVTGLRKSLGDNLIHLVKRVKDMTKKCILLGFGISNPEQVAEIMQYNLSIDAIVMGSAFVKQISLSYTSNEYQEIVSLCQEIKKVMSFC